MAFLYNFVVFTIAQLLAISNTPFSVSCSPERKFERMKGLFFHKIPALKGKKILIIFGQNLTILATVPALPVSAACMYYMRNCTSTKSLIGGAKKPSRW